MTEEMKEIQKMFELWQQNGFDTSKESLFSECQLMWQRKYAVGFYAGVMAERNREKECLEEYWYCHMCEETVILENVTYKELHDKCGHAMSRVDGKDRGINKIDELELLKKYGTTNKEYIKKLDQIINLIARAEQEGI